MKPVSWSPFPGKKRPPRAFHGRRVPFHPSSMAAVNTTLFYEILGVPKDADAEQIKRAWRKTALKLHPDKNHGDSEAESKFKMAKDAYETLSDPEKRMFYDKHGEEGLKMKEAYDKMDPSLLFSAFAHAGVMPRIFVVSCLACFCMLILTFPILMVFQIDHAKGFDWFAVFSPIIILLSMLFCCSVCVCVQPPPVEESEKGAASMWLRTSPLIQSACLLSFILALAHWLQQAYFGQGGPPGPLGIRFIPLFAYELFSLPDIFFELGKRGFEKNKSELGDDWSKLYGSKAEYASAIIINRVLRVVLWALLVAKQDAPGMASTSWAAVLSPVWIGGAWELLRGGLVAWRVSKRREEWRAKQRERERREAGEGGDDAFVRDRATDEEADVGEPESPGQVVAQHACSIIPVTLCFALLAARLDSTNMQPSVAAVFAPIFAISGIVFCVTCVCVAVVRAELPGGWEEGQEEEEEGGGGGDGRGQDGVGPEIVVVGVDGRQEEGMAGEGGGGGADAGQEGSTPPIVLGNTPVVQGGNQPIILGEGSATIILGPDAGTGSGEGGGAGNSAAATGGANDDVGDVGANVSRSGGGGTQVGGVKFGDGGGGAVVVTEGGGLPGMANIGDAVTSGAAQSPRRGSVQAPNL